MTAIVWIGQTHVEVVPGYVTAHCSDADDEEEAVHVARYATMASTIARPGGAGGAAVVVVVVVEVGADAVAEPVADVVVPWLA